MFEGLAAPWHLIIIAVVFTLLFGAKRLPEMARALGQSARILRAETQALRDNRAVPAPDSPEAGPGARSQTAGGPPAEAVTARFDIYTGDPLPEPEPSPTSSSGA